MNKWLKKVVSRRRSINKSTSKINQELIPLVTKLVLFRATIWPLKISFPGCALKQENWVKTKRKEGRGGGEKRKYGVKKNPLFHCATTTNHFHKIFIQRVYGKIENVRQQVRQEGVKCWNAHGRGNGAYLRADPWRISSLSSYPWILTPVYGISTTYSRIHLSSRSDPVSLEYLERSPTVITLFVQYLWTPTFVNRQQVSGIYSWCLYCCIFHLIRSSPSM